MTRKEEIKEQSKKRHFEKYNCEGYCPDFEAGAQWADEHPAPNLVDIDIVCEAFCKCECCANCGEHKPNCAILGDFKQAMKGE